MKKIITAGLLTIMSMGALAGPYYQSGSIGDLTVIQEGILINLDTGLPDNCKGSVGWMIIKQEYTALSSVVLATWVAGKAKGKFYTLGVEGKYCLLNQFDPNG